MVMVMVKFAFTFTCLGLGNVGVKVLVRYIGMRYEGVEGYGVSYMYSNKKH